MIKLRTADMDADIVRLRSADTVVDTDMILLKSTNLYKLYSPGRSTKLKVPPSSALKLVSAWVLLSFGIKMAYKGPIMGGVL